jgi:serine/threonine-protein kinase
MGEPAVDEEKGHLRSASAVVAQGKYRLFATLGRGGMAEVYLGVAQGPMGFNKLVVVKKLRDGLADDANFVNMFLDEGRLAARLNHPNVIHTYEIGQHDQTYFLAMEYLDGQPLSTITKTIAATEEKIDPILWVRVISDALGGLHHAHELKDYDGSPIGIIHRDVSPQNLFITYDGRVKLVDFGIAKAALNSTQTETGVLKGKIAYMAPEQAMGVAIDRRADVFAMGVVLWELLAGRRMITGDAAVALHKLLNVPIRHLTEVIPDIDPALDAIVMKAVEKTPTNRFQSAQEMRAALDEYIRSTGRMVNEEQISELVMRLYKDKRAEVQKQIQRYMADMSSDAAINTLSFTTTMTGSLPTMGSVNSRSQPRSGSGSGPASGTGSTAGHLRIEESDVSAVKPATEGKSKKGLFAVALAVALAASVALFVGTRSKAPAPSAAPVDVMPAQVQLTIVAAPTHAQLFLDDVKLSGNPFIGRFPRDNAEHRLRAEAPGFTATNRVLFFQSDQSIEMSLQPVPVPVAPAAAPPAPEKPKPVTAAPRTTPRGAPPPKGQPAAAPTLEADPWK